MYTRRLVLPVSLLMLVSLVGPIGTPQAYAAGSVSFEGPLKVNIDAKSGFYDDDLNKMESAVDAVEQVLNSEEFRYAILNFTYDGKKQFVSTTLTNEQVYDSIMAGKETYSRQADHVANLDLNVYWPRRAKRWSVVGYGYPGQPEIYMNWYYFNSFTLAEVAGNIAHEWTHKIGFDHDYNATARRPYSVPYAVGNLVIQLVQRLKR